MVDGKIDFFERADPLFFKLPEDQVQKVIYNQMCDIDQEFLGFTNIYKKLSEIIPMHFTVIDLGCAYAPQCFYFEKHKQYVGVDIGEEDRFSTKNTEHFSMTIEDFIRNKISFYDLSRTFAICSYVPPWYGDNRKMVRENFENCFIYYPASDPSNNKKPA